MRSQRNLHGQRYVNNDNNREIIEFERVTYEFILYFIYGSIFTKNEIWIDRNVLTRAKFENKMHGNKMKQFCSKIFAPLL